MIAAWALSTPTLKGTYDEEKPRKELDKACRGNVWLFFVSTIHACQYSQYSAVRCYVSSGRESESPVKRREPFSGGEGPVKRRGAVKNDTLNFAC